MSHLALLQVLLVVASCFDTSKGSQQIICKDESPSSSIPSPLSSFTSYRSSSEDSRGTGFYIDSLEDCARFCLLTSKVSILNCTGFQYQHGVKCLLQSAGCLQNPVVENNANFSSNESSLSEYFILKGYNKSTLCTSAPGSLLSPTPTIQAHIESTTVSLPSNKEPSSCIVISITATLLDVRWEDDLSNSSSLAFKNLSWSLKQNIYQLYVNGSTICNVVPLQFSNFSTNVLANVSVLFNESLRMHQFNVLYRALYRLRRIHNMSITTHTDNLPGKPPANLAITMTTDSTADLSWTHASFNSKISTLGYKVTYTRENTNVSKMIVTDHRTNHIHLQSLESASNYSIQITSITRRGFGESSLSIVARTTEKVKVPVAINVTLNLPEEKWVEDLSNTTHPTSIDLQTRLRDNINQIYSKQNTSQDILIYGFRRTTNSTNSTVQVHFGMLFDSDEMVIVKNLEPIYDALYRNSKLYDLSIELVQDDIPGKPPTNITWTSPNPYTINLQWIPSSSRQCGYFIFYKLNDSLALYNNVSVNYSSTRSVILNLQPFTFYSIWIQSITAKGLGLMSDVILARSMEQTSTINLSFLLLNLSNPNDEAYKRLQNEIQIQLKVSYTNNSQFRDVQCCFFRNSSDAVIADLSITFGQDVSMSHFSVLYDTLYIKGRIGDVHVRPLNDTIPGKPPKYFTATPTGTTSVHVTWSARHQFLPREWLLFYNLVDTQNTTLLNLTEPVDQQVNQTSLENLEKYAYYVIWIRGVTQWGLGIPSEKIIVRTLEEVVHVHVEMLVLNLTASQNNSVAEGYNMSAIAQDIRRNVGFWYMNNSKPRDVKCVVRNSSEALIADLSITFGQDVSMSHFSVLYDALYIKGRIGDVHVRPLNDTIPGKPPMNLTAIPTGTTSVHVTWSKRHHIHPREWLLFYNLVDSRNTTVRNLTKSVNERANQTSLENLEKYAYYVIWIRGVTQWGLGIPSEKIIVRTLEEVLPVNITLVLPNVTWDSTLLNSSSVYYQNTTERIRYNIRRLYANDNDLKDNVGIQFRNGSSVNVTVDISMVFSQSATARDLNVLYEAIYRRQRIHELNVKPVTDNIPGKPPDMVTSRANSTTRILLNWNKNERGLKVLGFRIFYKLSSSTNNMSSFEAKANTTSFLVYNLEKFREYTFWVSSVTRIGTGSLSRSSSARTMEELQPISLVLRFPTLMWYQNLSLPDSEEFNNLSYIIKQNVFSLYDDNKTQLRDVVCNRFTNGSVIADITIVYGQHVSMEYFATLYRALYVDGQLYNLTAQPVNDNVPGKPPVNVTTKVLSSTSIQVTWSCSDCATTNNTIAFLVSYRANNSRTNTTQGIVVNSTDRHVMLTDLEKFTPYMVWVTSVTRRGNGIASDVVYDTTLEDAPSKAPTNILAYNTSSTTVVVAWGEVPIGYVHGILQGYVIEYKQQHNSSDQWKNTTVNNATTIKLTELEKFTWYQIRVMAFTRVGKGPAANVTVSTDEDVPSSPPANIQGVNTSSTSIQVTWSPVPAGFAHGIVLGYHILYRRSNDSNTSYVIETAHAYNFSYVLRMLNKYTEYKIAMMAFTKKGNGSVSNEISVFTDEDTPGLPPPNVESHNTSSTSLNVTWDQIPRYYIHGILRGYRVLYRESRDAGGSYSNASTLANSYEISGLKKFTHYSVKVLGFTVKGDGVASEVINVTTDEDIPSRAPVNVTGHNTSSTSLLLTWSQVPHGYLHGILRGYKVLYKIDNDGALNYTFELPVNTTRLAVLSKLRKFTIYRITVLAFTVKGNGPMAENITVMTDEDIPSLAPTNLTAHNLTSTSLTVNWDPVPAGHVHGILRGYRVLFKMAANTSSNFTSLTTTKSAQRLEISSLKKFTIYLVKVLAFTIKGDGPTTKNISVSTDEDVPSLPPQNLYSYNTSSTTLNVTWSDIPECCVHGILLGYRVLYRVHKRRSDRSADNQITKDIPSPTLQYVQLTGLVKFADYEVQVLGYTRIGDGARSYPLYVTTDEDNVSIESGARRWLWMVWGPASVSPEPFVEPSKPPDRLHAHNTSSTSLKVSWSPVPKGYVHGILLGYRLHYKAISKSRYNMITISRSSHDFTLTRLKKYTQYNIKIAAFTRIGDGPNTADITVRTDEDVPSETPRYARPVNKASSTTIPVKWSHIPPPYVHGILRGYHVRYKLVSLADEPPYNPSHYKIVTARANETSITLKDLESFAKYEIKIAGFTSKGDGKWATFYGVTCTCHPYISTNWWAHPPYVRNQVSTNGTRFKFNGMVTPIGGIFPPILMSAVKKCCGTCLAGSSSMDFKYDGHRDKAQKPGLLDVKDRINGKSFISFPIGGTKDQTKYIGVGGEYEFVSIIDMPGAAFIVADRRDIHREVLIAILNCWPTVIFVFIVAYLAGAAIWLIDVHYNPQHFPRSFIHGTIEGFWWAFITMTTVGYGDRIPKSVIARLFAVVWIWMGIATIAVLTSSITASLMSMVFKSDLKLYGTKVAAIDNSSEYKLGVRRNSILVGRYGNIYDIYRDLKAEKVHAALLDSYSTASEEVLFSEKWLRVRDIIKTGFESTNGVVLGGDAQKLGNCMRNFMHIEENGIHKIVQDNVKTIKASNIPPAIKTSSSLLTSESNLFKLTALILGVALAVLVVLALMWEFGCRRRQVKKMMKKNNNNNKDIEGSWPLWAKLPPKQRHEMLKRQMRKDMNDFFENFRRTYEELRRKHALQIAALREQKKGVYYFSVNEWTGGRSATYAVTKDGDINSILDGLDLSMFDGNETEKKQKLGF